jgi:replicative DNA helicase
VGKTEVELERLPPQNVEAEQSVLGAVLLDNTSLTRVVELLRPEDFYRGPHRKIFENLLELFERGEAIDLVTLKEKLQQAGDLEAVGGASYLASLLDVVPTAANVIHHSRIVREKAILRRLIEVATDIVGMGFDGGEDVDAILDSAESKIFQISGHKIKPGFHSLRDVIKDAFVRIESLYEKKELVTGVATGFEDVDRMTSGLQPSDLVVIAGRPSMGKTALCLNIAQHVSIESGLPVAVFSLEMSRQQLVQRMLCSEARVDSHKLRTGFLSKEDWPKLTIAAGRLSEAPIYIDDTPSSTVMEIRAKARRLQSEHKDLSLVVIDYLQLITGRERIENRQQEITEISRSLKAMAKELDVPVMALSQLSRAVESRGKDRRPQLSDLRESGAIEQDADVVAFIYRDEMYNPESPEKGLAEVIFRKQRNGPVGTVKLSFLSEFTRFEDLEDRYGPME